MLVRWIAYMKVEKVKKTKICENNHNLFRVYTL